MPKSRLELNFPAQVNLRALAAVSKFCGIDDSRAYLMGVRVEIGPRDVVYVATDGKRLMALRQEKQQAEPDTDLTGRFTIPTLHCRAFKLKKDQDPTAELYGDEERLTIKRGDVEVAFTPLQDGEFIRKRSSDHEARQARPPLAASRPGRPRPPPCPRRRDHRHPARPRRPDRLRDRRQGGAWGDEAGVFDDPAYKRAAQAVRAAPRVANPDQFSLLDAACGGGAGTIVGLGDEVGA